MPRSPNAVLSLLPAGPKAVGSQTSAGMCRGSRGPAHQASRKRVYVEREEDVVLPSDALVPTAAQAPPFSNQVSKPGIMHPRPPYAGAGAHWLKPHARCLPASEP